MKKLTLALLVIIGCGNQAPTILPTSAAQDLTPIQLCTGAVPSYPSTFPEYAFCINNNLYAVYSANDGFLTILPPGSYHSNAIGSSCTFTVLANCQVTP